MSQGSIIELNGIGNGIFGKNCICKGVSTVNCYVCVNNSLDLLYMSVKYELTFDIALAVLGDNTSAIELVSWPFIDVHGGVGRACI